MNNKIKLLTFYSDSHKEFYEKYFLESFNEFLKDDFKLHTLHVGLNHQIFERKKI